MLATRDFRIWTHSCVPLLVNPLHAIVVSSFNTPGWQVIRPINLLQLRRVFSSFVWRCSLPSYAIAYWSLFVLVPLLWLTLLVSIRANQHLKRLLFFGPALQVEVLFKVSQQLCVQIKLVLFSLSFHFLIQLLMVNVLWRLLWRRYRLRRLCLEHSWIW